MVECGWDCWDDLFTCLYDGGVSMVESYWVLLNRDIYRITREGE